ncbi:hypothetical protein L226DRAFT_400541 [Lentinus tigrinus ALCF2SS1-7]|uniref:uncharacterized protein n=1 Tax=Lentinus tigrinus ALCF2SS1-7 TaxID=1328758 RepID=UPI001166290D|nr:hypothetical protein L226DRAFT_400541 [Lentinus tigrinus ALCF2SS1-7]
MYSTLSDSCIPSEQVYMIVLQALKDACKGAHPTKCKSERLGPQPVNRHTRGASPRACTSIELASQLNPRPERGVVVLRNIGDRRDNSDISVTLQVRLADQVGGTASSHGSISRRSGKRRRRAAQYNLRWTTVRAEGAVGARATHNTY